MLNILRRIKNIIKKVILFLKKLIDVCRGILLATKTVIKGERCKPGREKNEKVLIMGNGPSLKEINIQDFIGTHKIACVNFFPNQKDFFVIKPEYYIIIDPGFWNEMYTSDPVVIELFDNLEKVDWKLTVVSRQGFRLPIKNNNIAYEYISYYGLYTEYAQSFFAKLYQRNLVTCGGQNVMISAIYYFVMKKYKNIYVAGLDMSEFKGYSVDKNNHVLIASEHFYGTDYYDCTDKGEVKLGEFYKHLGYYVEMLRQFYHVAQFAKHQNVNVYNLALNSFVDVFEKVNLNDNSYKSIED